ncbi:MAG: tail fiber domain-containing protein, partial [bacterium]
SATHTSGRNFGIKASTSSPNGYAGYFLGGRNYFGGNVGIGTPDPLRKLHIYENVNGTLSYPIKVENFGVLNGTATGILFKVDGGNEDRGKGAIVYERTDLWNRGDFHILQRPNLNDTLAATLADAVVTVKNNGNVGIGTKTPSYKLQVGAAGDGSQARANAWNLLSSREYKRDIEPLDQAECRQILERAAATDVVRYSFTNDPDGVRHLGVIAEESPREIVASDGKGVSLGDYSAFLLAAIKAQQAEIEALKTQVKELESRVSRR